MAEAAGLSRVSGVPPVLGRVGRVRLLLVATMVAIWEALSASGFFYRDVIPSLLAIARAMVAVLAQGEFYRHLAVTLAEVATALAIGGSIGILLGLLLGANRFLSRAFEHYLYWLGPTPKIIFFPIMIMWFGIGPESKIAMGAISCFFPIVLSTAAGMRAIDPILIRVGQSFKASPWQAATKIYLPAMREPVLNGVRLGLGVAIIGTLLAETKLSNAGIGYLIMQAYAVFDMPRMYAMLIVLFALAIGANELVGRCGRRPVSRP
ncbi:MAG TPA: ABC transporter permease [Hyphomicrobiaceae bacterium]|nr:ABC transporter permease [Hyphomicrobiaceae bacterium]